MLRKIYFLALVIFPAIIHAQSCVVAIMTRDTIWVGADSRQFGAIYDSAIRSLIQYKFIDCKIQHQGNMYFAAMQATNLEIFPIAKKSYRAGGTVGKTSVLYKKNAIPAFYEILKKLPNPLNCCNFMASEILFFGFENNKGLAEKISFRFDNKKNQHIHVSYKDTAYENIAGSEPTICILGRLGSIDRRDIPGLYKKLGAPKTIKYLINAEIKFRRKAGDTAGPVDIVRITSTGATWMSKKKACH
jgi:hypothetical protein